MRRRAPLAHAMAQLREWLAGSPRREVARLARRLEAVTGASKELAPGEAWTDRARAELAAMEPAARARWHLLFWHAAAADGARPGKQWLKEVSEVIEGLDDFTVRLVAWLPLVVPRYREGDDRARPRHDPRLPDVASGVLRGLVWAASLRDGPDLCRALGDLGLVCFRKIPNFGAVSVKAGNACIWTLSQLRGMDPVLQLSRMERKVRYAQASALIQRALETATERAGLSRADLEELSVPSFGLEEGGVREEVMGEHRARLSIERYGSVALTFFDDAGKALRSVPAKVKEAHAGELKELRQAAKDLEAMLLVLRDRLERLPLEERRWSFPAWKERYLDHPVVGSLARRLIWRIDEGPGSRSAAWHEGRLVDASGAEVPAPGAQAQVALWHPLGATAEAVRAWRAWLSTHEVTQPFKQAHREIYVLTDAELRTGTYSNRFAAHVLRQHQFAALCRERGWRYRLQGAFDSHNTPSLPLPRWELEAEYWVDAIHGTSEVGASGIYLQITTDQVRFVSPARQAVRLEDVPALVFSEVMRDVDLFASVCSIGTDPEWRDGGDQRHRAYWEGFAFGALSGTAETRKAVLSDLLPRLAVRDRCEIDGRFLVVRGTKRTYRIHLGSGNILMDPNGQYLCIVPARGGAAGGERKVQLPFEGDALLSIILSKAFLLAGDAKIKDPSILSQIERR